MRLSGCKHSEAGGVFPRIAHIFGIAQHDQHQSRVASNVFRRIYPETMFFTIMLGILQSQRQQVIAAAQMKVSDSFADPA